MDDRRLGMAVRARRHARGWRQVDLAATAGVGSSAVSELELGRLDGLSVRAVRAITAAVDLPVAWDVGWRRQDVDRLLDEDHAALGSVVLRRLERWGWLVRPEASFNDYGDRGRIDLVAFHPVGRILLIAELKTRIVDVQALLGGLDVKLRVARSGKLRLGWPRARDVVPAIIVANSTTNRRRIHAVSPLLGTFALRGHAAISWLRRPTGVPTGLLVVTRLPDAGHAGVRRAGRRRVRVRGPVSRSLAPGSAPVERSKRG